MDDKELEKNKQTDIPNHTGLYASDEEELDDTFDKVAELYQNRKYAELKELLSSLEPADIASFIEERLENEKEQILFFRLLPKELASDVFVEIDSDTQELLIKAFTDKELKEVIDDMFLDDTVDIIEEMPANVVKRILQNSSTENRKQINELLEYPEDSAGSLMNTEFISISPSITIHEAFDKIRTTGVNKETIYTAYVTNNRKKLIGVTTVKDMLLADPNDKIESIMDENVITVDTTEDKENVAMKFSKYDYIALPVIDKEGCLVGIVTVDDAVDVLQEEATEDIQKMAAIVPLEKPYLKQSVFSIWKARAPWLLILMVSATFTGLIMNKFQATLTTLLVACVPMLMDTSGNAGSQSSVTIIRALALDEIEFKDIFKIIWKEFRAGILLAITMAIACFAKLEVIDNLLFREGYSLMTCFVVSLSLAVTIIIAKFVGCTLPLLAKKIKLDPAVVASPFITTIVDALSLLVFCGISGAIL